MKKIKLINLGQVKLIIIRDFSLYLIEKINYRKLDVSYFLKTCEVTLIIDYVSLSKINL